MDLISFGIICWFVAFGCFSYLGIVMWGMHEQDEIFYHWQRVRAERRFAALEHRDKIRKGYVN